MVNHPNRSKKQVITPGRWRVFSWPQNSGEEAWCYGFIAKADQHTFAEHDANAKLMSDAPKFLALCREIEAHCQVQTPDTQGNPIAHAAEGKALRARLKALIARYES